MRKTAPIWMDNTKDNMSCGIAPIYQNIWNLRNVVKLLQWKAMPRSLVTSKWFILFTNSSNSGGRNQFAGEPQHFRAPDEQNCAWLIGNFEHGPAVQRNPSESGRIWSFSNHTSDRQTVVRSQATFTSRAETGAILCERPPRPVARAARETSWSLIRCSISNRGWLL